MSCAPNATKALRGLGPRLRTSVSTGSRRQPAGAAGPAATHASDQKPIPIPLWALALAATAMNATPQALETSKLNRGYLHPFWNGGSGRYLYGVGELPRTVCMHAF